MHGQECPCHHHIQLIGRVYLICFPSFGSNIHTSVSPVIAEDRNCKEPSAIALTKLTEPSAMATKKPSKPASSRPAVGVSAFTSNSSGFVQVTAFSGSTSTIKIVLEVPSGISRNVGPSALLNSACGPVGTK